MSTLRERLTRAQIIVMRSLMMRGGHVAPIALPRWQREPAIPLWRRRLIDIWWRQLPGESGCGPFFQLTIVGARVASTFLPAPRGLSGAGQGS